MGTTDVVASGLYGEPDCRGSALQAGSTGSPTSAEVSVATPGLAALAPEGLYVHIPFCVSVCPYCDFVVYAGAAARGPSNRVDELVAALHVELQLRADALDAGLGTEAAPSPLGSLYLGGGTPSLLSAEQVAGLIEAVANRFGLAADAEITLEANPGPDEIGDLGGFGDAGVTRLSLGAQSMARWPCDGWVGATAPRTSRMPWARPGALASGRSMWTC